jgi:hypothetical protein
MRATTGNARDHRSNDPIYLEYLADLAKEQAAIKAEQDALAAADEAADPELQFKRAADAEAQTVLELLKTGFVPESILPIERLNGRVIANEQAMINNWRFFAENTPSFKPDYMGRPLLDAAFRSQIIPTAPAYTALHNLMLQYGAYPEPPAQVAVTEPEIVEPVLTPSERAAKKYSDDRTIVVVTDPATGQQFTEHMLSQLSAVEERRLRRIAEKGTSFGSAYEGYLDVKDTQHARDQEIARRAAEEAQQ